MVWTNGPLTVYHGTDDLSSNGIRLYGINPARFRSRTDFGAGFYVTTVLHQAKQWANQRCRRTPGALNAEVLQYDVSQSRMRGFDICVSSLTALTTTTSSPFAERALPLTGRHPDLHLQMSFMARFRFGLRL